MEKLRQLNEAIARVLLLYEDPKATPGVYEALELQNLRDQRKTLMATFPPIRLVK